MISSKKALEARERIMDNEKLLGLIVSTVKSIEMSKDEIKTNLGEAFLAFLVIAESERLIKIK
jgi:hypothetical protein